MDVRILQYFLAVAREQNITAAAGALHISQPPLSRQLKDLEEELGTQLFIRGNRKITLTKDGMILRKRAQEIVDLMEKTKTEVGKSDEEIKGDVFIGGGETKGMRLLAKVMEKMQTAHPHVQFHIFSGDAYDVIDRLDKGLIDFGTLIEPIDIAKYDKLRLPGADIWGLLMRKDHPLAQQKGISPKDLKHVPILCSRQMLKENGLSGWLGYDCEELLIAATSNLINTPALMVEEGVGCALSFDNLVSTSGSSPLCFRPLEPRLESGMYLVWKKYQVFSSAAEKFFTLLHQDAAAE